MHAWLLGHSLSLLQPAVKKKNNLDPTLYTNQLIAEH
jgi:hypothetical protein